MDNSAASQEMLTPSNAGFSNRLASNMATPTRAAQTPRATPNGGTGGGRTFVASRGSGAEDLVMHKKLSQRRLAVYDRVYGQILFPPVMRVFIDSPEVQRLRDLKQLGNGHYVYPSATHTRFEHSLGVSHLAMTFLKQILTNHAEEPGLGESLPPIMAPEGVPDMQKDLWCLGIAGLCHDLGHGPLSHMFEHYVNTVRKTEGKPEWSHEQASISMLRSIWDARRTVLAAFGLNEADLRFIELMINGLKPGKPWPDNVGRSSQMRFMTDIIANKRSGLDVDKIDYLQRDSLSCFGSSPLVSLDRLFQGACVMRDEHGETQICYQSKLENSVEEIFQARTRLHRIVYQHRVTCVMDRMATDAFLLADKHFLVADGGREYRLSECVDVAGAYIQTGDWIINAILRSHAPELAGARQILDRTQNRRIYTTIGTTVGYADATHFSEIAFIRRIADDDLRARLLSWRTAHPGFQVLEMLKTNITKAAGDMARRLDPMDAIRFYNPRHGELATPYLRAEGQLSPRASSYSQPTEPEQTFVVFCRMPLTASDLNHLSDTFNDVATDHGASGVADRSVSPGHMRARSSSSTRARTQSLKHSHQPSQHQQQQQQQQGLSPASSHPQIHLSQPRPMSQQFKRTREGEEEEEDGEKKAGTVKNHADHCASVPLLVPESRREDDGEDAIMVTPQVRLQQQQQHTRNNADTELCSGGATAPTNATPNPCPMEDDGAAVDDVDLSVPLLSQLDNSRSNADEPDIHVGAHATVTTEEATGEYSNLGPPTGSREDGAELIHQSKKRKMISIHDETSSR